MHYYQFNIGDYRKDTIHLSRIEHSIYRDLIDWYYLEETPIPKETQVVIRRLRLGCESDILMLSNVLNDFFVLTDDGYRHGRIDEDIAEYHIQCDKNKKNGIKGGRPKAKKTQSVTTGLPVAPQVDATANPNHKPLTTNHEQLTNYSVTNVTGAKAPLTTDEIIFGYGVPLLTGAGIDEKHARSFLGGLRKSHGDDALVDALRACLKAKPLQPLEWLAAVLPPLGKSKQKKSYAEQQRDRIAELTGKSTLELSDVTSITGN